VRFWDVASRKEVQSAGGAGHHGGVSDLALSADGKFLTTYAADQTIRRWEVVTGKEKSRLNLPANAGNVALSADGKLAAYVNQVPAIGLGDGVGGKEGRAFNQPAGAKPAMVAYGGAGAALSPDGKLVAVRDFNQAIRMFETAGGKELPTLNAQEKVDN